MRARVDDGRWFQRRVIPCLVALQLAGGLWATWWVGQRKDHELRTELVVHADAIARAMDVDMVRALSFTLADRDRPEFQRLRRQMTEYAQAAGLRGLYSMALRNGRIVFGPENYATNDPMASPPGTVYEKPSREDLAALQTGHAQTIGLQTDEYGTFVSAVSPVQDTRTGETLMVIGVDMEASEWQRTVHQARLVPVFLTLLVLVLTLAGYGALRWRRGLPYRQRRLLRHLEAAACAVVGIAFSLATAWRVHDAEQAFRRESFSSLARAQARGISESLDELSRSLEDLGHFLESSQRVDPREFQAFLRPFVHGGLAQAWEWVPVVPFEAAASLENRARKDGATNAFLFQLDGQGVRVPVSKRETYYPVLFAEPEAGNEKAPGYDLGSEPLRQAALLEAARTGLRVATEPVTLVQEENGDHHGLLLFRPVYGPGRRPGSLRGFAVVELRPESVLRQSLRLSGNDQLGVAAALFQLMGDRAPRCVASTSPDAILPEDSLKGLRSAKRTLADLVPFFLFGKSHVIQVQAGPGYLATHPLHQAWIAGGVGLTLTVLLTGFVSVLINRRALLERQVQLRTGELRESESFQRHIMESLPAGVVVIDPQSREIESVNAQAAYLFGAPPDQIVGRRCHAYLCPALEGACPVCDLRREVDNAEREMLRANGTRLDILKSVKRIQIGGREKLLECFVDISDRKRAEAALRRSEENYRTLFERAGDGISILSAEGRYVDVNSRYCAMLDRSREEIIGALLEQYSVAATPAFLAKVRAHVESHGTATFEREFRRRDGTLLPVEVTVSLLQDGKTLAVVRDIGERKRAEEQVRTTLSELERMNRVMMNREQRVLDLKREVNELRRAAGLPVAYPSAVEEAEKEQTEPRTNS